MTEEFLSFIKKSQLILPDRMRTCCGKDIRVEHRGYLNSDSGPDFSMARIRIKDQLWIGQVEIHLRSSDWYRHKHDTDPNYDNVILHVVWEHDKEVYSGKQLLPTLELKHSIYPGYQDKYVAFRTLMEVVS